MVEITAHYFPASFDVESMLEGHLARDACVLVAEQEGRILGYSVCSCSYRKTPFHDSEIPLFFQHLLYVHPELQHRAVGLELQKAGMNHLLGVHWLFRRFAVTFLTNNPQVLRVLSLYNEFYPRLDGFLPDEIYAFCHRLGPMLGFSRVDRRLVVYGTNETVLAGEDYTSRWKNFLSSDHAEYDRMILNTVFDARDERVFHTGTLLMAIGYARPMHFVRRLPRVLARYHH